MLDKLFHVALFFAFWLLQRVTVGAVVAIRSGDKILLVRSSYKAGWNLPGGMLSPPEDFATCARREVSEELGLQLGTLELLSIIGGTEWPGRRNYVALFRAELAADVPLNSSSWEVREARWFGRAEIPPGLPALTQACIRAAFEGPLSMPTAEQQVATA
jgi:ADP-ribose pyrophosphatase YjhB (NUDIX family)